MTESPYGLAPYVGLTAYSTDDAPFFFGREREQQTLYANLAAARLPILYGETGVGKSSLLLAGLARRLLDQASANTSDYGLPKLAVVVYRSWVDDPLLPLVEAIELAASGFDVARPRYDPTRLDEAIESCAAAVDGTVFVILDEFEEYFVYHGEGDRPFAAELARALNRSDLPGSFLISIRDVAVSKLVPLREKIPRLLDNFQRLDHLDVDAAREAVVGPLRSYSALSGTPVSIEDALLDELFVQLDMAFPAYDGAQRVQSQRVHTSGLQLVLARLWQEEARRASTTLRLETLSELGGVKGVLNRSLEQALEPLSAREQATAAEVLRFMITPSGNSLAQSIRDLGAYTSRGETEIAATLARLDRVGVVRAQAPLPGQVEQTYAIVSDLLIGPLLDWIGRHAPARRSETGLLRRALRR